MSRVHAKADTLRLVAEWNERQAQRAPLLFWERSAPRRPRSIAGCGSGVLRLHDKGDRSCPARSAPRQMITGLIPALQLPPIRAIRRTVKVWPRSIADGMREEHRKRVLGD
jgi:hypothetical protein